MSDEQVERCPKHPDLTPVWTPVRPIDSHQADYPTRWTHEWRCTICG